MRYICVLHRHILSVHAKYRTCEWSFFKKKKTWFVRSCSFVKINYRHFSALHKSPSPLVTFFTNRHLNTRYEKKGNIADDTCQLITIIMEYNIFWKLVITEINCTLLCSREPAAHLYTQIDSGVPRGDFGVQPPHPEIPKALKNRAKLNPIVKTVKDCWI